jgi:hypothetical protein
MGSPSVKERRGGAVDAKCEDPLACHTEKPVTCFGVIANDLVSHCWVVAMVVTPASLILVALLSQSAATASQSAWDDAMLQWDLRLVDRWTLHDQDHFGEFTNLPALACWHQSERHSLNSDLPTQLKISNERSRVVRTFWIDHHGKRIRGETVRPGASAFMIVLVMHPVVVTDEAGKCIAAFQPVMGAGHAHVDR